MTLRSSAIQAYTAKKANEAQQKRQKLAVALEILGPLVAPPRFKGRPDVTLQPSYYLLSDDDGLGTTVIAAIDGLVFFCNGAGELILRLQNDQAQKVTSLEDLGRILLKEIPAPLPANAVFLPDVLDGEVLPIQVDVPPTVEIEKTEPVSALPHAKTKPVAATRKKGR